MAVTEQQMLFTMSGIIHHLLDRPEMVADELRELGKVERRVANSDESLTATLILERKA